MARQDLPYYPWLTVGAEVYQVWASQVSKVKVLRFQQKWVVVQAKEGEERYRLSDLRRVGNRSVWDEVPSLVDPSTQWAQVAFWRQRFKARLARIKELVDAVDSVDGSPEHLAKQIDNVEFAVGRAGAWINEHPDVEKED